MILMPLFIWLTSAVSPPSALELSVSRLGPHSDSESIEEIGRYGCEAVPFLVRQLREVRARQADFVHPERHPDEMRAIWTIAALRYITAVDFYARHGRRRSADKGPREQMLQADGPPGFRMFFGIWSSRGIVYFSSRAEQRAIIRQWLRYSSSGACVPAAEHPDSFFWLYGSRQ